MSRRHPVIKKRDTKITIPALAGPHVRLVFAEMARQNVTYDEVEQGSGVLRSTLKAWRHKNAPGLTSIEAVLGFLGFDFVPVPRAKVLPKPLLEDLVPIAERHGLTLERTIGALIEITAAIHENVREAPRKPKPERKPGVGRRPRAIHPDQPAFMGFASDDVHGTVH